ncbi:metallophosphoesterase family protein [Tardiphaga sp. 862_B3_N4_1]|uniref:metallophosphoesterase family protein n=1 Tax=Tardiphaga sp. 862_B3_N4_1 TaxID=3240764 RepID=UPI003F1F5B34
MTTNVPNAVRAISHQSAVETLSLSLFIQTPDNGMTRTYCIGDIHGCYTQVNMLITQSIDDAAGRPMQFIFLGDYIDRGPKSRETVDYLIDLQRADPDHVICLKGNHEDLVLAAHDDDAWADNWLAHGGQSTLESYGVSSARDLPPAHINWLRTLPTLYRDQHRIYVHAGINPDRPLHDQDDDDLLWMREPFLSSTALFELFVIHGHTPLPNGRPDIRPNRLNIDTGAVYGGPLTAAVFDDLHREAIRFLSAS